MQNSRKTITGLATSFAIGFWLTLDRAGIGIGLGRTMGAILAGLYSFRKKEHSNAD